MTHPDLDLFAVFCALAERFGGRWSRWPAELRHPSSPAVARAAAELAPRVAYHAWLQGEVQRQLRDVRAAARDVGVRVVHDLAVGCDPEGFDGWAWQDVLALGARVGAPPDAFSQQGQDWGLPPWRPDRLDATGYAAYRDLVRALLRQADGLRVDHVAGLFRLWWVPPGVGPAGGTYVHSDAEVMLAVLTLEAHRAGALVIGEDLGTVEPEVTEALHERGMLSSAVLWFTRDRDAPGEPLLAPDAWPEQAVASVSTHDLPTVTGFLRAEHVRARAELGLLDDVAADEAKAAAERAELVGLLRAEGLVGEDADRGRAGHRHPRAARREPFAAGADRAVRRRRRRRVSPTCPARSTSTRTGGYRCRCPSTSCARTRWWPPSWHACVVCAENADSPRRNGRLTAPNGRLTGETADSPRRNGRLDRAETANSPRRNGRLTGGERPTRRAGSRDSPASSARGLDPGGPLAVGRASDQDPARMRRPPAGRATCGSTTGPRSPPPPSLLATRSAPASTTPPASSRWCG